MSRRATSRFSYDRAAVLYVVVTFLLGIGSLHSQNNLLFIAFGVAVGVLLVNGTYAWASLARVRVRRHAPSRGEVGRVLILRCHVTTRARVLPAGALLITEIDAVESCESAGVAAVAMVLRGTPARVKVAVVPARRGELRLDRMDVSSRFPFGAVKKTVRVSQPARVLVRPRPVFPSECELRVATAAHRSALASLSRAGIGDEVLGLREYVAGDAMRRIAWRSSARHGRLVVRQYAASATDVVRVALQLDSRKSERANEDAISLAAGTLVLLSRRGQRVALCEPTGRGRVIAQLGGALDALARLDCASENATSDDGATVVIEATEGRPLLRAARRGVHAGVGS